jgi:peptidyl-prolyl cis-trans isomerase C
MKTNKLILIASALALSISLIGCNKAPDNAVLARVNQGKITAADFKNQLEDLAPQMQQAVANDPKARKEFLEDLIGIELVLQEARRQGLDKDAEFRKRQETLKKEMERRIQEDAKNELFNVLLKKELADQLKKLPMPTDKEVRDYYMKNQDKMRTIDGKKPDFKAVELQLKRRMLAERQRDLYLEYAKGLKAKAKITVDEKALDAAAASLAQAAPSGGPQAQTLPATQSQGTNTKQ